MPQQVDICYTPGVQILNPFPWRNKQRENILEGERVDK
jgi:hypothetical protein